MLCHGGSYGADDNRYLTFSFHCVFWGSGAVFRAARTSLFLKENNYSIGTIEEKSFVGNYVSDSLHLNFGSGYIFSL